MPIDLMSMAEGADPAEARKSLSKRNSSGLQDNPFLRSDSQKAPSGAALEKRPSVGSGKKWTPPAAPAAAPEPALEKKVSSKTWAAVAATPAPAPALEKKPSAAPAPALETKQSSFLKNPRGQSQKGTFISDALEKQPSVKKAAPAAAPAAAPEPALEKKASSGSVPKVSPRVDAGVEAPGTTEAKELEELKRSGSSMKDNPFMRRDSKAGSGALDVAAVKPSLDEKKPSSGALESPKKKAAPQVPASAALTLDDTTVTLAPYFKVKDLGKFKEIWKAAYDPFAHKDDCVHYSFGFTEDGTRAHCREAYTSAKTALQHLADVDAALKAVLDGPAELERLEVHGPKAEIDQLIEPLTPFGCKFFVCEWGFRPVKPAMEFDSVVHLYPYFTLKDAPAFKKIWGDAYPATKAAATEEKSHQYAFSFEGDAVASCRESYGDADGVLTHLGNVDTPLNAVLDGPADLARL